MKRILNKTAILLTVLVALPFLGFSQDLVTDRPDFTESATAVPQGNWQFEFGYTVEKDNGLTNHSLGELLIRYSPLDKLELRIGINSFLIQKINSVSREGFEDMQLGLKWAVMQDNIALIVSTTIPTGGSEFRSSQLQPGITLALAKDINNYLSVGANLGFTSLYEDDNRMEEYSASFAAGIGLTAKLGMFVEYFGFYYSQDDLKDNHYIDAGFTYLINPTFQVDFRAGRILSRTDSTYFIGTGAVVRF